MERFIEQVRAELGLRRSTILDATAALFDWLRDPTGRPATRLLDRSLAALNNPHRDDVLLAMALRRAGMTLDQGDRFVELFLANFQTHALEADPRALERLKHWLARTTPEGDSVALPH